MRRVDYMVGARDFSTLKADQFMQDVVSCYQDEDTGAKLAGAMAEGGFGSVPILAADGTLIGIVSEFDLLQAIMDGKELEKVTAGEIMTKDPIAVNQDTPAREVICLLQEKHLIRVPVIDGQNRLIGVVARRDVLEGYLRATKPVWRF